jgi:hypothetical protein
MMLRAPARIDDVQCFHDRQHRHAGVGRHIRRQFLRRVILAGERPARWGRITRITRGSMLLLFLVFLLVTGAAAAAAAAAAAMLLRFVSFALLVLFVFLPGFLR